MTKSLEVLLDEARLWMNTGHGERALVCVIEAVEALAPRNAEGPSDGADLDIAMKPMNAETAARIANEVLDQYGVPRDEDTLDQGLDESRRVASDPLADRVEWLALSFRRYRDEIHEALDLHGAPLDPSPEYATGRAVRRINALAEMRSEPNVAMSNAPDDLADADMIDQRDWWMRAAVLAQAELRTSVEERNAREDERGAYLNRRERDCRIESGHKATFARRLEEAYEVMQTRADEISAMSEMVQTMQGAVARADDRAAKLVVVLREIAANQDDNPEAEQRAIAAVEAHRAALAREVR